MVLIRRAVKTTIQILYDECFFDHFNNRNAYEVLKDFVFVERHKPGLQNENDAIHWFYS